MNQTDTTIKKRYYRHLVLKVNRYGLEKKRQGSLTGVVAGKVMGGPLNGRTISLSLKTTSSNGSVAGLDEFANPGSNRHTPPPVDTWHSTR